MKRIYKKRIVEVPPLHYPLPHRQSVKTTNGMWISKPWTVKSRNEIERKLGWVKD